MIRGWNIKSFIILSLLILILYIIGFVKRPTTFNWMDRILENKLLIAVGTISYEVYLVHAFMFRIIKENISNIALFLIVAIIVAILLHQIMKIKDKLISK